jgi:hypothetical protein
MVTIKNGVGSFVAGLVGAAALCAPTDMGADLSAGWSAMAVHAESDPATGCPPVPSPANSGGRPLAARLEFTQRDGPERPVSSVAMHRIGGTERSAPSDPRPEQSADVARTLPASAAPATVRAMPSEPKLSLAAIRALQRELKRHGCYAGALDGDWGPASRYAAATFTAAVNAKLAVDQPNEFLLALARQHRGAACQQTSNIKTASTTHRWRATVATNGASDPGIDRPATTDVSAYAPRLTSPPRIVRANGTHPTVDLTERHEMPPAPAGEMDRGTKMALGAQPAERSSEPDPVTRDRASRQERRAAARKRASRQRWKRQVYQSVNLSGS